MSILSITLSLTEFFLQWDMKNLVSFSPETRCVILVKRTWVQVPVWLLAGLESQFELHGFIYRLLFSQLCLTLCYPMDCSTPGLPVHHQLLELTQTHGHQISDAIQPSHTLVSPSPLTFNFSQHQDLFQWVSSSHQVAKVLEFQLQPQSFQWIFRTDFL